MIEKPILKAAWVPVDKGPKISKKWHNWITEHYVFTKRICDRFIGSKCKVLVTYGTSQSKMAQFLHVTKGS